MKREPLPHTVIMGDIENYSPGGHQRHVSFQDGLHAVLKDASERAQLRPMEWVRQGTGDGELALLPADIPKYYVVSDFLYFLGVALGEYNRDKAKGHRIRLRLAVDWGDVVVNGPNFAGNAPIRVARLSDCAEFKRALAESQHSDLAVIVSEGFFREVVRDGARGVDPRTYWRVRVDHPSKNFSEDAWIHVPGSAAGAPRAEQAEPVSRHQPPSGPDSFTFNGDVKSSGAMAFGTGSKAVQDNNFGGGTAQGRRRL